MSIISDFHVHPDYSIDAAGTVRQYCDRALEIGLLVLVVVLVIAGLAVALRRKGKEGEESQTYY